MATTIRPEVAPAKPEQPDKGASAIADPGPLGLAAFAMTTFMLSVFNANIIGTLALIGVVLPLALFYGGAVQILAGMWAHEATGLFLLAWTIFTAYMLLASFGTNKMLTLTFACLFATFLLLAIGFLAAPPNANIIKAGGVVGLVTAGLAWYISAAGVTNASLGRTLLPVFPWKK